MSVSAAFACRNDGESLRNDIKVEQANWERELAGLKAQHAALNERFTRARAATNELVVQSASVRLRATVDGVGQSLADVAAQARQAGQRLEEAASKRGEGGRAALIAETNSMREQLNGVSADLALAAREINRFGKPEGSKTTDNEHGDL